MKTFSTFLTEGGTVAFEGTIGDLKKSLRPGEYIKWNARGPQSDSTKCTVILKDYDDYDYFSVESEYGMTDFGNIAKKK